MSVIRVAVPVFKAKRRFHLDKGRTWSVVEHLILASIVKKNATAQVIADQSRLPRRVVMEAIIRLMEAGWVELSQRTAGTFFGATENGKLVAPLEDLPTRPTRIARNISFITDRVTGTVFRPREMPPIERHVIDQRAEKEPFVWIEPCDIRIDDYVRSVVSTLFNDDERFVSMDATGDRPVDRFAMLTYRNGNVEGLPQRAPEELEKVIRSAVQSSSPTAKHPSTYSVPAVPSHVERPSPAARSVVFSTDDLVLGAERHRDLFTQILRNCKHELVIHSTFISHDRFEAVMSMLIDAAKRGARIDILWGQNDDKSKTSTSRRAVNQLRQAVEGLGLDDVFRIYPFSTGSHSKIIVADMGAPDRHLALVGSCNWLSSNVQSFEASMRVREPSLVSDIVYELGELSLGSEGHWTELTSYLARLAFDIRLESAQSGPRAHAKVVLGPEHGGLVRMARDSSEKRIFVMSHRLGPAGRPAVILPLIAAAEAKDLETKVYYGIPSGEDGGVKAANVTVEASFAGVRIRPVRDPRVHAKLLAWDDDYVVVSSQNWLSADPSEANIRREVGIFLHAAGAARHLIDHFEAQRKS